MDSEMKGSAASLEGLVEEEENGFGMRMRMRRF